jgi:hypothetical protein
MNPYGENRNKLINYIFIMETVKFRLLYCIFTFILLDFLTSELVSGSVSVQPTIADSVKSNLRDFEGVIAGRKSPLDKY